VCCVLIRALLCLYDELVCLFGVAYALVHGVLCGYAHTAFLVGSATRAL